jgi:octaprenyl-diphosphate synthase
MIDTSQMKEYTAPVQESLEEFDRRLADYLRGDSPLITSIARHLLRSRGKRIRPAFLFLASGASQTLNEHSVDASLAIELIHTATLLHDDVVDESEMRRGSETVNAQWTNLISVLMGDYLFAKAFRIMVQTGSITLMEAISSATERVSVGELRQIEETGNLDLAEEEYLTIIADKTASLFTVSCEAGPILGQVKASDRSDFATFGEKVGTAFQIADDLLDFVGDPEVTGKDLGNDVLTGKMTLPLIYSLRQSKPAVRREMGSLLTDSEADRQEAFARIYDFVQESGGIDYAYRQAGELAEQGLAKLSRLQQSPYLDSLTDLVTFTTRRAS